MCFAEEEERGDMTAGGARLTDCTQPITDMARQLASKQVRAAMVQARPQQHVQGRAMECVSVCSAEEEERGDETASGGGTHKLHTTIHTRGTTVGIQAGAAALGQGSAVGELALSCAPRC